MTLLIRATADGWWQANKMLKAVRIEAERLGMPVSAIGRLSAEPSGNRLRVTLPVEEDQGPPGSAMLLKLAISAILQLD
jgi:hypothetical protein